MDKAEAINIAQKYAGAVKANYNKRFIPGRGNGSFSSDFTIDIYALTGKK